MVAQEERAAKKAMIDSAIAESARAAAATESQKASDLWSKAVDPASGRTYFFNKVKKSNLS